jgi:hypothetical protein
VLGEENGGGGRDAAADLATAHANAVLAEDGLEGFAEHAHRVVDAAALEPDALVGEDLPRDAQLDVIALHLRDDVDARAAAGDGDDGGVDEADVVAERRIELHVGEALAEAIGGDDDGDGVALERGGSDGRAIAGALFGLVGEARRLVDEVEVAAVEDDVAGDVGDAAPLERLRELVQAGDRERRVAAAADEEVAFDRSAFGVELFAEDRRAPAEAGAEVVERGGGGDDLGDRREIQRAVGVVIPEHRAARDVDDGRADLRSDEERVGADGAVELLDQPGVALGAIGGRGGQLHATVGAAHVLFVVGDARRAGIAIVRWVDGRGDAGVVGGRDSADEQQDRYCMAAPHMSILYAVGCECSSCVSRG